MNPSTQCARILAHLRDGKRITGLEALHRYGCIHLPRRILDLKQRGYRIEREMVCVGEKRVAEYRMGAQ